MMRQRSRIAKKRNGEIQRADAESALIAIAYDAAADLVKGYRPAGGNDLLAWQTCEKAIRELTPLDARERLARLLNEAREGGKSNADQGDSVSGAGDGDGDPVAGAKPN